MNGPALTLLGADAPPAATARERAQRCLDTCPVHPAQLATSDPRRILYDLVSEGHSEADEKQQELDATEKLLEAATDRERKLRRVLDEAIEAVCGLHEILKSGTSA